MNRSYRPVSGSNSRVPSLLVCQPSINVQKYDEGEATFATQNIGRKKIYIEIIIVGSHC